MQEEVKPGEAMSQSYTLGAGRLEVTDKRTGDIVRSYQVESVELTPEPVKPSVRTVAGWAPGVAVERPRRPRRTAQWKQEVGRKGGK